MLFNSFTFFGFFAVLVILYYLLPQRFRWIFLLAASLFFYAVFNVGYVLLLVGVILATYLVGLGLASTQAQGRRTLLMLIGAIASLAPLIVYKYYDFLAESLDATLRQLMAAPPDQQFSPRLGLLLPAGLSFFTFSAVSYVFDVYWNKLPAERNLINYALYVSFFPKLLAGPIERATNFLPQLLQTIRFNPENVTIGLQWFLWGLFKKVVIADRLAVFVDNAYRQSTLNFTSPADLIIATYFFAFQLYCDFSGYSDMAIGAAKMLGIDLMENFRRPYLATSVSEFWGKNRWHISLNKWFRDYMYFPLGGSRVGRLRLYFNLMVVFIVSGLWHGAAWTFAIWGALNGLYQVFEVTFHGLGEGVRRILPRPLASLLGVLFTFHLILISWVFFRAPSIDAAITILRRIGESLPNLQRVFASRPIPTDVWVSIGLIALLMLIELLDEKWGFWERLRARPTVVRWAVYYALILLLLFIGNWGMRQFVYMQF